ncbi:MAG: metallophosphoesterase [Clostridia bacterium]|nr:metallophosphoesterase [Clostridia bacterium]
MKKLISIILCLLVLSSSLLFASAEDKQILRFSQDGTFKILHLTDPQDDQNPSFEMLNLLRLAIEQSQPDLIVLTGDIVEDSRSADPGVDDDGTREGVCVYDKEGEIIYEPTYANVKAATGAILGVINASGVPFAVTQGNNDYYVGLSNKDWLNLYAQYENCLVHDESSDSEGRIDYHLEIKGSHSDASVFNLWMMDSGDDGITRQQVDWYTTESNALAQANGGTPVPAFEFQHIQPDDIGNLFERCHIGDEGARFYRWRVYRLNKNIAHGYASSVFQPCEPTELFKAWKQQGDVIGAFFGHRHYDGFSGVYDGIEMNLTYGCEFAKQGPYGARLITLNENDLLNYGNELYRYTGSVKTGDAALELQADEPYAVYNNFKEAFLAFWKNIFITLKNL